MHIYEYEYEFEFEYEYEFDINIILSGTAVIYIGFEAKKFEIGNCEIVKFMNMLRQNYYYTLRQIIYP